MTLDKNLVCDENRERGNGGRALCRCVDPMLPLTGGETLSAVGSKLVNNAVISRDRRAYEIFEKTPN